MAIKTIIKSSNDAPSFGDLVLMFHPLCHHAPWRGYMQREACSWYLEIYQNIVKCKHVILVQEFAAPVKPPYLAVLLNMLYAKWHRPQKSSLSATKYHTWNLWHFDHPHNQGSQTQATIMIQCFSGTNSCIADQCHTQTMQ